MPTSEQLAWMAGVFDLKSRIFTKNNKTRKTRQHTWNVESTELVVVRRLSALTGTKPEARAGKPVGEIARRNCIEHCPDAHVHVDERLMVADRLRWTATGAGMVIIHHNVKPYLQVDRGYGPIIREIKADPAIMDRGSGAVLRTVTRLYRLGWEVPAPYVVMLDSLLDKVLDEEEDEEVA